MEIKMQIYSERARQIDAYIASHSDSELGKWPLEIGGEKRILPFYRIPTSMLLYNANNGRLAMEIQQWQEDNGRNLDNTDKSDAATIKDMLLALEENKTRELKDDLARKGQMEPGVITHNGIVINANRRMAVIEALHIEQPTGKWKYLEVVRLPQVTSESDLWRIEAGLQLSKDKIAEYHPVNELLKIKEGTTRKLRPSEIAAAMYGRDESYVEDALERLQLIDEFLNFMGQSGKYGVIKKFGLHEYFIDIQNIMNASKKDGVKKQVRTERVKQTFTLLRANVHSQGKGGKQAITHRDLRKLRDIYRDAHAQDAFTKRLNGVKKIQDLSDDEVLEGFNEAVEILQLRDAKDKPVLQVQRAIRALNSIDRDNDFYREAPQVVIELNNLVQLATEILDDIHRNE